MTTLSNEDVVAQVKFSTGGGCSLAALPKLGYTAQVIHDSTGGWVPKFWRPPYGDSDNRVRAIAKEVNNIHERSRVGRDSFYPCFWSHDSPLEPRVNFTLSIHQPFSSTGDWSLTTGETTPQIVNAANRKRVFDQVDHRSQKPRSYCIGA
ncbi:hypothetical protein K438DRAFT_789957 [Mycena galopus ATCC 62051]|nr:hypothetical protein K438DRAFT_789957 [Mycena galopus ATCC 62051]